MCINKWRKALGQFCLDSIDLFLGLALSIGRRCFKDVFCRHESFGSQHRCRDEEGSTKDGVKNLWWNSEVVPSSEIAINNYESGTASKFTWPRPKKFYRKSILTYNLLFYNIFIENCQLSYFFLNSFPNIFNFN